MRNFSINIKGRVKNFPLPKNQPLIPLFEAIINSLHAIEERKKSDSTFTDGHITIKIVRDEQLIIDGSNVAPPISGFEISDNGVGFNEPNFDSFLQSDSTYKESFGGKGVGRFSWLVAFNKATIESIYKDNGEFVKRLFDFSTENSEIDDTLQDYSGNIQDNLTTVKLCDCLNPYKENMFKQSNTIAMKIIQHCLIYFVAEDCPLIELIDYDATYSLNQLFHEKIKTNENTVTITIKNEIFQLLHVKAEDASVNGNKLFLCAHNRLVEIKELEKYITDLDKEIYRKVGFWYVGVLTGRYFDQNVDMNRLSFSIPEGGIAELLPTPLSMDQILGAAIDEVKKYLDEYLTPVSENKTKRIKNYVTNEAPQFRHLIKYMPKEIAAIKPNLSDERLDDELHKIKRQFDKEIKAQNAKLLENLKEGVLTSEQYIEDFQKQLAKVSDANGAALAEYVAHRKVIIDLLESAIKRSSDGRYQKEAIIHDLIYPMRSTSETEPYNKHNLWLVDERLAYCSYISSDIPFDNDPKQERTDIMILDHPVAVSEDENDGTEFDTIILFELKRPMRDDYTEEQNPISQLYDYIDKIKSKTAKDKDGRPIIAGDHTKFYLYVICDVTDKLRKIVRRNGNFSQTPDGMGYYGYNDDYKAYVEILPLNKVINDAKKRNRILFEKLGL